MKKFYIWSILILMTMAMLPAKGVAQAPEKFTYQAVVRNASNQLVSNGSVRVRVSILRGSASGTTVYTETHTANTNANGLLTLQVGGGNATAGSFSAIDWGNGPYFMKSEIDPNGGTNYTVESVQQLLSVPYAMYATEAGNGFSGDYNDLTNTPDIPTVPTNVSAFANDAGYLTSYTETDPTVPAWAKEADKPAYDYSEIANTPTIPTVPTNVSSFANDAGYVTNAQCPSVDLCTVSSQVEQLQSQLGTMQAAMDSMMANQTTVKYTITAGVNALGCGFVTGGGIYPEGNSVLLTAFPSSGFAFVNWQDGTTENPRVVTVTGDAAYTANFVVSNVPAQTYTISVSANDSAYGTVSGGGTYQDGASATVTASAVSGYRFMKWTENNSDVTDAGATYIFTAERDRTLVAQFAPEYAVTVSANPSDGGSVSGNGTYVSGESVTVTASAESGYHFVNWTENGSQVSTSDSYTFTVTGNRNLVANFAVNAPETVNVIVLSGAKQYATTLQNTITSGTITATTHNVSVGSSSGKLMVPRNTAPGSQDKNGCVILYPIEHTISTAILYDGDNQPLISNNSFGLPISSSDSTIQTTFEYNNQTYNGYVLYQFNVLPEKIEFTIQ